MFCTQQNPWHEFSIKKFSHICNRSLLKGRYKQNKEKNSISSLYIQWKKYERFTLKMTGVCSVYSWLIALEKFCCIQEASTIDIIQENYIKINGKNMQWVGFEPGTSTLTPCYFSSRLLSIFLCALTKI